MAWTKTPPTKPGYYWLRGRPDAAPVLALVRRAAWRGWEAIVPSPDGGAVTHAVGSATSWEWWPEPVSPPAETRDCTRCGGTGKAPGELWAAEYSCPGCGGTGKQPNA